VYYPPALLKRGMTAINEAITATTLLLLGAWWDSPWGWTEALPSYRALSFLPDYVWGTILAAIGLGAWWVLIRNYRPARRTLQGAVALCLYFLAGTNFLSFAGGGLFVYPLVLALAASYDYARLRD
jgi:hypothetical protein